MVQSIGIKGIRLEALTIDAANAEGHRAIHGSYSLMSTGGKVLATQNFGLYGAKIPFGPKVTAGADALVEIVKQEIEVTLGFTQE